MSNLSTKKLRGCLNPRYLKNPIITGTFFPDCGWHRHEIDRIFLPHFPLKNLSRRKPWHFWPARTSHDARTCRVCLRHTKCHHALCRRLEKGQIGGSLRISLYWNCDFRLPFRRDGLSYFSSCALYCNPVYRRAEVYPAAAHLCIVISARHASLLYQRIFLWSEKGGNSRMVDDYRTILPRCHCLYFMPSFRASRTEYFSVIYLRRPARRRICFCALF